MSAPPYQDDQGPPRQAVVLPLRSANRLRVINSAGAYPVGEAVRQVIAEPEEALIRLTNGILHAAVTLESAIGQAANLRRAAVHTLDLLDGMVREARDAAFAGHNDAAPGLAKPAPSSAAVGDGRRAACVSEAEAIRARSASCRTKSLELRARTLELAALSAALEERLADTFGRLADSQHGLSADLRAISRSAASHAIGMRQWARDHPPSVAG